MPQPVDYRKWAAIAAEGADDDDDDQASKKTDLGAEERRCEMTPEDREEHRQEQMKALEQDLELADESWMHDVDLESYEDFTIKRVTRVVKPLGADHFKAGDFIAAEQQWLGAQLLVQKVGLDWPGAAELMVQLKCNLAQLCIRTERWDEVRQWCSSALELQPNCEKALFRRSLANIHFADWHEARRDLNLLLLVHPKNSEAKRQLAEVDRVILRQKKHGSKTAAGGLHVCGPSSSGAYEELNPEGTLRKLAILQEGPDVLEGQARRWQFPWARDEWLGTSRQKAALRVHVTVRSMGGEDLFNTKERVALPETPEERDELRIRMVQVAELDNKSRKLPRTPEDFLTKETLQPLCWRYGDPCVYAGFELASRSMHLGEIAVFEIDQPLLEASVAEFYKKDGGIARVAGLPNFRHHIEDRKLNLLAQELPEWELELESKKQRTVRAELELCSIDLFDDLSPQRTGEYLLRIADPGRFGRKLVHGLKVEANFRVSGALSGMALYRVDNAVWVLGQEGQNTPVERPGMETVWIPACVGQVFQDACRSMPLLYPGARLEARLQNGPTPMELNPKFGRALSSKRAWNHRPPVSIVVEFLAIVE